MINIRALASLAVAFAAGALTSPASAQSTAQVGTLACDVSAGIGMILMQKQTMTCVFTPASGSSPEPYLGRVDEFGVALGAVNEGPLVWGVIAPSTGVPRGAKVPYHRLGFGFDILVAPASPWRPPKHFWLPLSGFWRRCRCVSRLVNAILAQRQRLLSISTGVIVFGRVTLSRGSG